MALDASRWLPLVILSTAGLAGPAVVGQHHVLKGEPGRRYPQGRALHGAKSLLAGTKAKQ